MFGMKLIQKLICLSIGLTVLVGTQSSFAANFVEIDLIKDGQKRVALPGWTLMEIGKKQLNGELQEEEIRMIGQLNLDIAEHYCRSVDPGLRLFVSPEYKFEPPVSQEAEGPYELYEGHPLYATHQSSVATVKNLEHGLDTVNTGLRYIYDYGMPAFSLYGNYVGLSSSTDWSLWQWFYTSLKYDLIGYVGKVALIKAAQFTKAIKQTETFQNSKYALESYSEFTSLRCQGDANELNPETLKMYRNLDAVKPLERIDETQEQPKGINDICAICQDPITPGEITALGDCGHVGHAWCITQWIARKGLNSNCPTCRKPISDKNLRIRKER